MTFPDLGAWLRRHRADDDSITLSHADVQGLHGELQRLRQSNDRMRKQNSKLRKRMTRLKNGEGEDVVAERPGMDDLDE